VFRAETAHRPSPQASHPSLAQAGWFRVDIRQRVACNSPWNFENRFSLCNTLPWLDRLLIVPDGRAVSEVVVVVPLDLVKTDDDEKSLLRLDRSLGYQVLGRDRGSWRVLPAAPPLEVTDRALCLQLFPPRELASGSSIVGIASDQPLSAVSNSSRVLCCGLDQKLCGLDINSLNRSTSRGWGRLYLLSASCFLRPPVCLTGEKTPPHPTGFCLVVSLR